MMNPLHIPLTVSPLQVLDVRIQADDTLATGGIACAMSLDGLEAPIAQLTLLRSMPFSGTLDGALIVDLLLLALDAQASGETAWVIERDPQPVDDALCVTLHARTDPSTMVGIRFKFRSGAPLSVVNDPRSIVRDVLQALSFDGTVFTTVQ